MNVMAPEWVLLLFMKQYGLPREEAIERIKVQRDIETYNQTLVMEWDWKSIGANQAFLSNEKVL